MLSRRNIRVKTMQVTYMHEQNPELQFPKLESSLKESIQSFYRTWIYNLYLLVKTTEHVVEDATIRAAKHLPSNEDKNVSVRIFHNQLIQKLALDENFTRFILREKLGHFLDKEVPKKFFLLLAETPEYKAYAKKEDANIEDDRQILLFLFKKVLFKQEFFHQHMEDNFPNWLDDSEVINFAVINFLEQIGADKPAPWQTDLKEEYKFATDLLNHAYYNEEYLTGLIVPKLKNWDKDRLAQVDLLLMKLALCEMLYFPNIPIKVTLNEYLDIARQYSTPKSNEFINGILDKIMKELLDQNLINKTGRGLVEK